MERSAQQTGDRSPQQLVARRYDVERSCLRCHERKVRCDRAMPCSTCLRINVPCQYPGPGRTKRRSKNPSTRRTRLGMPERAIIAISNRDSPDITSRSSSLSSQPRGTDINTSVSAGDHTALTEGFLVKDGTSTRYVNEVLFSRVLEKVSGPQHQLLTRNMDLQLLQAGERASIRH